MSARHPRPDRPPRELRPTWQAASLLLGYPDDRLEGDLETVHALTARLPAELATPLRRLADHLRETPVDILQPAYVETFDTRRRCSLFLTYFAHGDTRKRGVALLRFKQTYLRSGFVLDDSELPDHLCVVLEYAATVDADLGWRLLLDHRAGLEVLRLSLESERSPWVDAIRAVCGTLPPLRGDESEAVRRLAAEGPPAEEVGLSPYGGPAFDARLQEVQAARLQDLPQPTLRGAAR
jgi:nitrate reductase molybdenum cofactor assembly chaperone NarJ/NarW